MADTPGAPVPPIGQPGNEGAVETPQASESNKQFEVFAKKERMLRKMQADLQKQKQEFEAKAKAYETDYIPKGKLKDDPFSVLEEVGYSYEDLTQRLLQQPTDPATKALMNKIKALEDRHAAAERAAQENAIAQEQQVLKQISTDVKLLIDADPEFESVKSIGQEGIDAVTELIKETFDKEGYIMDTAEAAKQIENYLVEQAVKMASLRKVQAKLAPKAPEATEGQKLVSEQPKAAAQGLKTLSQNMQTQQAKPLSAADRKARAIAAFYGKLNN